MALIQTGDLLAVATDHVVTRDGREFDFDRIVVFDVEAGDSVKMGRGRNLPTVDFNALRARAEDRPSVSLRCSIYRGELQVEQIISVDQPKAAATK